MNENVNLEQIETKEVKEYQEERFEFALYVNDFVICKRNFKINNYIDESMQSLDFKFKVDEIVKMIDDDLKSKSRVFTWYYGDVEDIMQEPLPELNEELLEPWECTFKFVVYDNHKEVISKIWDGYGYPKSVRDKVDLANKTVKVTTRDGRVYTYNKNEYFEANKERLSPEMYVLKAQILDKPDILIAITKKICEACSPREEMYHNVNDYAFYDTYYSKLYKVNENGEIVKKGDAKSKKYCSSLNMANKKVENDWAKATQEKTKNYFKNLF